MKKTKIHLILLLFLIGLQSKIIAENGNDTVTINLEISDGQNGTPLPDSEEESPGAFTVANKNDTDGDGTIDNQDNDVQGEIDLMKITLHPPTNADPEVECTLKLPDNGNVKLFKASNKVGGEETKRTWTVNQLPKTFWVELQNASTTVRSEVITWSGAGKTDMCKATGIWVTYSSYRNKLDDKLWDNCGDPVKQSFPTLMSSFGKKFGRFNENIGYGIGFEFRCFPNNLDNEVKVKFDVTRQKQTRSWKKIDNQWSKLDGNSTVDFPHLTDAQKIEFANDDERGIFENFDNDNTPDKGNFIYSVDAPGIANIAICETLVRKCNFNEFVRVTFNGIQAVGPGVQGSSASEKVKWHMFMGLKKNDLVFEEDDTFINSVNLSHREIPNSNENAP